MIISEICIRRPVFATVLSLAVLLVGLVSYTRLAVREYPKIDEPVVTVESRYTGASAEIVESQVTKVLEDSLAGIEGIATLTSISRSEQSQITIKFRLERDADSAANDVRDRVARVRGRLPKDIDEPVVAKVEADANPIIWLAFSSEQMSALEVTDYASRIVKTRLQTLPGAADVRVFGERRYAMRIWVDRDRLAAYRLTPADVEDALRKQNLEVPAGRIESREREFSVVAQTDLNQASEFAAVVVKNVNGFPVRIGDIGKVEVAAQNERSVVRFNGRPAVALGVIKQSTANPLVLSKAVRAELPNLVAELPPGMRVDIAYDSSVFIERSIDAVFKTIIEAVALVALVIFVSLRSLRATIIPLVTIPVSLIGAFTLMYVFNFSINTLTMLAFVLAIGLVVDDAIVMLENIYRHVENGVPRLQAALQGAREIGFAVVAMTITLAAVYAPVAFMTGRTGKLFVEFALTLAGAVLVSGFVALTLSPMMCSVLLKHEPRHSWLYNQVERFLNGITQGYKRLLTAALGARWAVLLLGCAVAGTSVFLFKQLKQELSPLEDRGVVLAVFIGPEGATIDYMQRYQQRAETMFKNTKDVERYFVITGFPTVSQGISFIGLTDWDQRQRKSFDVARELQPKLFGGLPGVLGFPITPASLGQSPRDKPVQMVIVSSLEREKVDEIVNRILVDAAVNPNLQALESDLKLNKPEVRVRVDRNKANDTNVQVDAVGRTLETMLGGRQVTRYKQNGEQYDVIVQVVPSVRSTPDDISNIFVRGRGDQMIPLEQLVSLKEGVSAREFNRFGQRVAVTISANLAPGYPLGEALKFLEEKARVHLPPGTAIDYNGQSREFRESSAGLALTFLLALAFIYLVLAAQFESFADPFIIMLSVPLSMTGALAALLLTGGTLNVYSQIGLVTLVGLITKHGILIVEFTNQLREQGKALQEALIEAAVLRLRPILMTTGAMVLGAVPLALARGAGAESRSQIGWVIVGGMLLGTLLTLFVVPTVYSYLARRERAGAGQAVPQPAGGN